LLDAGAKESLPIIQQAFEEGRVDEMLVDMEDVEEHFGLRERRTWELPPFLQRPTEEEEPPPTNRFGEEWQKPYVAEVKAGPERPLSLWQRQEV
jgi:hypothetical protein